MRKFTTILFLLIATIISAQQVTFAEILSAEPEVKTSKPEVKKTVKTTYNHTRQSSSPLKTLNGAFFESYLCILGNVGKLSHTTYDKYGIPYDVDYTSLGFGLEYELGARFARNYFVGIGIGARTYSPEKKTDSGQLSKWGFNMPLYGVAKIYMITNYNFSLSADFGVGGIIPVQKTTTTPYGMLLKIGLGADVRRFVVSAGYEMITQFSSASLSHFGYLKFGVIISK